MSRLMSAGFTPLTLEACPKLLGLRLASFNLASARSPGTELKSNPLGIVQESRSLNFEANRRSLSRYPL